MCKYLGPGLQSFLKVKVTLTLREVILRSDNLGLNNHSSICFSI